MADIKPTKLSERCNATFMLALNDTLNVLSGKWKLHIMGALLDGKKRFTEIENSIPKINPRMLSKELKELEVNGMKQVKEPFMGALRSKADYFTGYSLIMFFVLAMSIALLWIAGNKVNDNKGVVAPFVYPVGIAYIGIGVVEFLHFFPFAACVSLLAGLLAIIAVVRK